MYLSDNNEPTHLRNKREFFQRHMKIPQFEAFIKFNISQMNLKYVNLIKNYRYIIHFKLKLPT